MKTTNQHPPRAGAATKTLPFALALLAATAGGLLFPACSSTSTRESTGEYIDSSTITTKVKAALVSDELVHATEVKVTTYKGIVQLSGFVSTQAEKDRAAIVARNISGVKSVENNITVKPAGR